MGWPQISLRPTDVISLVASVKTSSGAVLAALLLFSAVGLATAGSASAKALETAPLIFITPDDSHTITVEIADTAAKRSMGLMFRRSLAPDKGMIFLYPQEQPVSMWMKNTYLSLDMIFVRADGTIHRIEKRTEPFSETSISSQGDVLAVVEMIAGSADRLGLKAGHKVDYPAFN